MNTEDTKCVSGIKDDQEVTLWIIRWQDFLSKLFHSRLIASVAMFYFPIMAIGYILEFAYNFKIFSRGIFITFLWIAIAPLLIRNAFNLANNFFRAHVHIFKNKEDWEFLHCQEIARFQSSKYLIFGLPWGIITSTVVLCTFFYEAPLLIQLWSAISFFILFFISSIGFYGIYVLITMMQNISSGNINFYPYHPDKFGGLSCFGSFSVKIALYFSSGALVFPAAFEIINKISNGSNLWYIVVYFLIGFYMLIIAVAFIYPIFEIKKFVDPEKERIILESWGRLDRMMTEFRECKDLNIKQGIEIFMHYYFNHSKLLETKDYPWDFRVLLEFGLSFVIPVGVAILEIFIK